MMSLSTALATGLIDQRNRDLFEKLATRFEIDIISANQNKLDYFPPRKAIIYVDGRRNLSLFTHELLHLELRYFGLNSIEYFNLELLNSEEVRIAYNLCNNLEHILMFDEFERIGFRRDEFVEGISTEAQLKKQVDFYKTLLSNSTFCSPKLFFVSFYFTIKSEQYLGYDRKVYLDKLRNKNPLLFSKCEVMFNVILDLDLVTQPQDEYLSSMKVVFSGK